VITHLQQAPSQFHPNPCCVPKTMSYSADASNMLRALGRVALWYLMTNRLRLLGRGGWQAASHVHSAEYRKKPLGVLITQSLCVMHSR
jgi:hypothetical protein